MIYENNERLAEAERFATDEQMVVADLDLERLAQERMRLSSFNDAVADHRERVRAIRRKVSKSARDFERRFGIPAATLSNWEQGRRTPDPAAQVLLRVIERDPEAVLRVLGGA